MAVFFSFTVAYLKPNGDSLGFVSPSPSTPYTRQIAPLGVVPGEFGPLQTTNKQAFVTGISSYAFGSAEVKYIVTAEPIAAEFSGTYVPAPGNGLAFLFTPPDAPLQVVVPYGYETLSMGDSQIECSPYLYPSGFDSPEWGATRIRFKSELAQTVSVASFTSSAIAEQNIGRALRFKFFVAGYSAPYGAAVPFNFTDREDVKGIFAGLGDQSSFGTAAAENSIRHLLPPGIPSLAFGLQQVVKTQFVLPNGVNSALFGAQNIWNRTQVRAVQGFASSVVSQPIAINKNRDVAPSGWVSSVVSTSTELTNYLRTVYAPGVIGVDWGAANIRNRNVWVGVGGISPPSQTEPINGNRQLPNPWISFRVRQVTSAGNIFAFAPTNAHYVAQWVQYVDQAGRGISPGGVGTANAQFRVRTVYPTFIAGPAWGVTAVKRRFFVDPSGWGSSAISENAELLINTRRVYVHSGASDQAQYGEANVFNWRQDVGLHNKGWYDTQWNFPVVYNLKQEIVVAPFEENVNPDKWTNFFPFVENKDREVRAFGHQSSRVGLGAWARNAAEPVYPAGTETTLWGAGTFIAHRNRTIQAQGWDSFYNERYTVVWNKADVVGPAGVGDSAVFGRPNPVANLNREIKHHSGWLGPEWGLPFIAYRVRSVFPNLFYDVPASFPEVRFNPHPITPVGIPWQGQVGGHEVRVFRREALPKSVNVHDDWFGEPIVTNRNRSVGPYGYDQSEFGRPDVQNFIRYIAPEWINPDYFTPPLVTYRTRTVYAAPITVPVFPVVHRVRKDSPDPPSQQRITLNDQNGDGDESDGLGIPPPPMGVPWAKLATLYPPSITGATGFGAHAVKTNAITPLTIFEDGLLGTPTLIFTQIVFPEGVDSAGSVSKAARLSPWNIYAPYGDAAPIGYTPGRSSSAHVIRSEAVFGSPTVTNQHRSIGPVPARGGQPATDFDFFPKFGTSTLTLRRQYAAPNGIRSLRFGQIVFLNVPQYIDLDDETNRQGIAPNTQWGANAIGYPPVQPSLHRPVYPVGFSAILLGTHRVELLHRTITASGIPHRGNPQHPAPYNTNPWGTALVGYPRTYTVGMGVQTLWGNNLIEFLNRPVYPVGWNNCSLEDGNFDDYRFPMKVIRKNPLVRPTSVGDVTVFGTCTVSHRVRTVYSRGVDSYNSGSHSVKASSTIGAQGWESLLIGDIDRWEAGKIKAHGDDMSEVGTPRLLHPLRASGFDSGEVVAPRIAPVLSPIGIPNIAFDGPSVTNPFGCTNRVVSPLPILSNQTVPSPVVA